MQVSINRHCAAFSRAGGSARALSLLLFLFGAPAAHAAAPTLELAQDVAAREHAAQVQAPEPLAFAALHRIPRPPEQQSFRFQATLRDGEQLRLPPCAGRAAPSVRVDGRRQPLRYDATGASLALPAGAHAIEVVQTGSRYEQRIACAHAPRWGAPTTTAHGLRRLRYDSPNQGKKCGRCSPGEALVYVPRAVAEAAPGAAKPPLLIGLYPWHGAIGTYAAYAPLLEAAERHGVVLLFPDGLGNSLYTAPAEDEVLRALDALERTLPFDAERVALFGASMGGAGATTIGLHHPDRFASVTSLFGDSKYDLSTYVRKLLPTEAAARQVNALDVLDNARNLPVFLLHGEADTVSPPVQSTQLHEALRRAGFHSELTLLPGRGHEGTLVTEQAEALVRRASELRRAHPRHVSYRGVRPQDQSAYGVAAERVRAGAEVFFELQRDGERLRVLRLENVRALTLRPGALGFRQPATVEFAPALPAVPVRWLP